ncbi:histidinol dehydrogenase [Syntrophomonas wolfei]|uniref:Histidinol dehydrogenase n=1 Tax=Syntrophomonas wolfei subsp. wolfei (strain DSM 2245B / Goettingen) TaxID=335541 RepID=Q0AW38_SYNWW|nr:histidinol dehydrogenase [Syntrophomonas wolfei]ABI69066.1 histidinol dehydrogenase [Syntrophomonas wolfei subsp. wolfei str. Goettingen G311]
MNIKKFDGASEDFKRFLAASNASMKQYEDSVGEIGRQVQEKGNQAIFAFTLKFDGAKIDESNFLVSEDEIEAAYDEVDDDYIFALDQAIDNIATFHSRQLKNSWMEPDERGNILGQLYRPLERVGIYVPGGTAAYPSSVLMNAIPAQVAGVSEIAMVTPPAKDGSINPYTLVAAAELGIEEIYKMGGAQAVFALAYGTETINKVDLISGPGNIYVTIAKKMVYGDVNIDMLAGPSEILIVADKKANPAYLAADMMSQAEHDVLARSILVTDSETLIERVQEEIEKQVQELSRQDIIRQALENYGALVLVPQMDQACAVANLVAPEHLELMVEHPFDYLSRIRNAGAIFLGKDTPEPVGDYFAGPNHILPTGGTARFYSPVSVDTFMKSSSIIYYSPQGIKEDAEGIMKLAEVEGLTAHANSIRIRVKGKKKK